MLNREISLWASLYVMPQSTLNLRDGKDDSYWPLLLSKDQFFLKKCEIIIHKMIQEFQFCQDSIPS